MESRNTQFFNTDYNVLNNILESFDNMDEDEGYQFDNEMFVDDEEILSKVHNINTSQTFSPHWRRSPVGQSLRQHDSRSMHSNLSITPQKHHYVLGSQGYRDLSKVTPKRNFKLDYCASYSVPTRKNSNLDVFAPMIAHAVSNRKNSAQELRRSQSVAGISPYRVHRTIVSPTRSESKPRSARVVSSKKRLNMNSVSSPIISQALKRHHSLLVQSHCQSPANPATEDLETTFSVKKAAGSVFQYPKSTSMAVISPMCRPTARVPSTPTETQYMVLHEEDSFIKKSFSPSKENSYIRSSPQHLPVCSLFIASSVLLLSGAASFLMSFYLIALMGRTYYLNIGVISGTISMLLGMLGFRFRDWEWLPNRNYVSGFVLTSLFSFIHMLGLLVLIRNIVTMAFETMDLVGGALCCISVIGALIASFGLVTSCCCKYPPPDNRVAHAVEGFTV